MSMKELEDKVVNVINDNVEAEREGLIPIFLLGVSDGQEADRSSSFL